MSQCHDTYDLPDHFQTHTACIELEEGETAIYATATMTFDGQAIVGKGEAAYQAGPDSIATRSATAQALVALGQALMQPWPSYALRG